MRKYLSTAVAIALMSGVSYADLQNVEVSGSLQIRGNSFFSIDGEKDQKASQYTEQRTTLGIKADFTDDVSANITFENYGTWGVTDRGFGGDFGQIQSPGSRIHGGDEGRDGDSVRLHEAYITLGDAVAGFDLKIGRQEVMLGSEFIIGNNSTGSHFDHVSYDGIVGTYSGDSYDVTLLSLKVNEEDGFDADEVDEDSDLYAIYATYNGFENHTIDGYVFFERTGDANDDNDELYTIGARAAGTFGSFDYEVEIATQSGDDGSSSGEDYKGLAINSVLGYTFDTNMQPRVWIGFTMFTGDDEDNAFVRNHSDWEYSEFLGDGDMTNVVILRAGVSANVTEKIALSAVVSSFELEEKDDSSALGEGFHLHIDGDDDEVGLEIGLYATYQYSEDVALEVGVAQFMNGDLIEFTQEDVHSRDEEDQTYVYAEISVAF